MIIPLPSGVTVRTVGKMGSITGDSVSGSTALPLPPSPRAGIGRKTIGAATTYKKQFGMHFVSFHVVSKAFVPECDEEPFTFSEAFDVGLRAQYAGLTPSQPSLLPTRVHEARTALRKLKQVAGGAESDSQRFPIVHFGSATPSLVDDAVVEHEPEVAIETEEDEMIYPKQFVDSEPPFEQSFMDNLSVKLGFFEPATEVSANFFNPLSPYISSTHDSTSVADTESDDGDLHGAVPPPAPRVGGVRTPSIGTFLTAAALPALILCNGTVHYFADPDLLDTGPADFYNVFNLDSGFLDSDCFGIYSLDFQFENCNNYNLCELYSVDHSQGG
ncbi:hypothetical protein CYMTET_23508 [Cymbomonas tetramitiformis]|uniref:Uncharacterized protein n=1 Tax=Cymbomonas tetramitiformis TaxID=36881 RepID=A0AAE0FYA0_9CHLO|nr:hypothetical protein CYMTET_23508 [Cymbomonas tetramitiformis]